MDNENYQNLRNYALKLLSFRPRSVQELKGKLSQFSIKRGISSKILDKVLTDLTSQNFINDAEFIKWWVEQRRSFRPKGQRAIRLELLQKGIDKETIEKVLSEDTEEKTSEYDLAMKVVNKKIQYFKNLPKEKIKIKTRDLLLRRGFDWEVIHKVIDSLVGKTYNTN